MGNRSGAYEAPAEEFAHCSFDIGQIGLVIIGRQPVRANNGVDLGLTLFEHVWVGGEGHA